MKKLNLTILIFNSLLSLALIGLWGINALDEGRIRGYYESKYPAEMLEGDELK